MASPFCGSGTVLVIVAVEFAEAVEAVRLSGCACALAGFFDLRL